MGCVADALVCLLIGSDNFVSVFRAFELALDIGLELSILRLHQLLEVLISHLLNPACCRNWKLPDQRKLDLFVRKLNIEHFAQVCL